MTEQRITTNGVELHVVDEGDGFPVVLCHGFPELSFSWRHQIPVLAEAGFRVLAPDQRGYGRSDRPDAVDDYDLEHLTDDMIGLLDAIGEERAVWVGHDWGSMVAWGLAQRHPDRSAGVVGMSVPFAPRGPMSVTQAIKALLGDNFFYILYFQEPGVADANLAENVEETMRGFLAGLAEDESSSEMLRNLTGENDGRGLRERLPYDAELPSWLTQAELDHYVSEFTRTGFTGGINWYRNFDRNWERSEHLADTKIEVPAAFIAGASDPVLLMSPPAIMDGWVTDLRASVLIEGAGHWVQQEKPHEVNRALLDFLGGLDLPY
jgi:pimeloyl-ACP methyl ester carboxylesterase